MEAGKKAQSNTETQKYLLKRYLGQFYWAQVKRKQLAARLREFKADITGVKAVEYSAVPKSQTNAVGSATESKIIKEMQIEEKLQLQVAACREAMDRVIDILALLPENSTERIVMEFRHIDGYSWAQITEEIHLTRTPCNRYYNRGIKRLLEKEEVQKILEKYAREHGDEE